MRNGRPKAELVITPVEREQLEALARSRSLPVALVLRPSLFWPANQNRIRGWPAVGRASVDGGQVALPLH